MSLPPDFSEFLKLLNCHHVDYLLVGAAIRAFGFNTPNLTEDLFLQRRRIVRMGHPPIRIEVMNEIDGVTFEECRPAAPHQHPCACDGRAALVEAIVGDQQSHRTSDAE
ncbi:MAG: hypothetical protein ACK5ES_23030, partial [Planctomyces sp.]